VQPEAVAQDLRYKEVVLEALREEEHEARLPQRGAHRVVEQREEQRDGEADQRSGERDQREEPGAEPDQERVAHVEDRQAHREDDPLAQADEQPPAEEVRQDLADLLADLDEPPALPLGQIALHEAVDPLELEQQEPRVDRQQDQDPEELHRAAEHPLQERDRDVRGVLPGLRGVPALDPLVERLLQHALEVLVALDLPRRGERRLPVRRGLAGVAVEELQDPVDLVAVGVEPLVDPLPQLGREPLLLRQVLDHRPALAHDHEDEERDRDREAPEDRVHRRAALPAPALERQHERVKDERQQVRQDQRVQHGADAPAEPHEQREQEDERRPADGGRSAVDQGQSPPSSPAPSGRSSRGCASTSGGSLGL
jgi:hypothetical protein